MEREEKDTAVLKQQAKAVGEMAGDQSGLSLYPKPKVGTE